VSRLRNFKITGVILGLTAIGAVVLLLTSPSHNEDRVFTANRTVQLSFTITNNNKEVIQNAVFKAYGALQKSSRQQVDSITASHSYQVNIDDLGNTVLEFSLPLLAPFESKVISVRTKLLVADEPFKERLAAPEDYLGAEPFIEIDHPALKALSESIISPEASSPRIKAKAIFDWVASNIKSEQYLPDDRGALWALENRRGDCTEFMYLFVALARMQGMPARSLSGYVVTGAQIVHPTDFHNWAEIYIDGAWHVVDPQRHVFLAQSSDYIATRIIQPAGKSLLDNAHRYQVDKRLTAVMN
jgi:transglutaminase-like putative cysteine protease